MLKDYSKGEYFVLISSHMVVWTYNKIGSERLKKIELLKEV